MKRGLFFTDEQIKVLVGALVKMSDTHFDKAQKLKSLSGIEKEMEAFHELMDLRFSIREQLEENK